MVLSSTVELGVKVAVQVMPPSVLTGVPSVPFSTTKSPAVRPVTASLKVMVAVAVSLAASTVSLSVMVAVGGVVSVKLTFTSLSTKACAWVVLWS